ncbi:hypothetical protein BC937DRAFT_92333 [Endogone sp. FLAS-F59071]|nr:hypothetical protein BC937DRAFT_92333 [Endogone sp. FLAS-F59071]|eukprot:RUS15542.1 hypothetical protein BC937DRAFT_92333 [Endogone sp. FLAS-F59071]
MILTYPFSFFPPSFFYSNRRRQRFRQSKLPPPHLLLRNHRPPAPAAAARTRCCDRRAGRQAMGPSRTLAEACPIDEANTRRTRRRGECDCDAVAVELLFWGCHVCDFRADPVFLADLSACDLLTNSSNHNRVGLRSVDRIYLDTTFCHEHYETFSPKERSLNALIAVIESYPPDTVFYFDCWYFGYEEIWKAVAQAFNTKVCAAHHLHPHRDPSLFCLTLTRLHPRLITPDPRQPLRLLTLRQPAFHGSTPT